MMTLIELREKLREAEASEASKKQTAMDDFARDLFTYNEHKLLTRDQIKKAYKDGTKYWSGSALLLDDDTLEIAYAMWVVDNSITRM